MKLRPLLVLLLFVVSAGVLAWIYYANTREKHTMQETPWREILADLDACSRRKHVKAAQYDHFAKIAADEGRADAAILFRAMAFSERLNEQNCARALVRLGGSYQPPAKIVVFRSTTDDNLSRSIDHERQTLDAINGADIRRAFDSGNRYAARVLIWAAAGDMRHLILMQTHQGRMHHKRPVIARKTALPDHVDMHRTIGSSLIPSQNNKVNTDAGPGYLVCPVCGNIYAAELCDVYCPFCLTNCNMFVEFR